MSTPLRRRTLRQRLLAFIGDAAGRLTAAWKILTTAQARLLAALAAIRPGRLGQIKVRAATADFQRSIADFNRAVGAFAERWAATDLPLAYREGALTTLDHLDRPHRMWTWTPRHRAAITELSAQYFADLMGRIQEALRRARAFLRAALDATRQRFGRFEVGRIDPAALRRDHPLDTVIYANDARHPVESWARAALSWQAVTTANTAAARTALDELGCEWLEVRDGPECGWETHGSADRADGSLRTVQDALAHPSAHPHCVVAGTQVEAVGGIQFGYRFKKSGALVEIATAGGNQLTITPNHPILTGRGWIPAGEVKEGDDVFVRSVERSGATPLPHLNQVPAMIDEVFAALGKASTSSRGIVSPDDFHGDGPSLDGDVDVVGADGQLWRVVDTSPSQQVAELDFKVADATAALLPSDGPLLQELDGLDLASPSRVGGCDVRRVVVPASGLDTPFLESVPDGGFAKTEFLGQAKNRLSIDIAADYVVKVRYFDSPTGHVYDLSTSERAYFANGILVHNCVREFLPRPDIITRPDFAFGGPF